MEESVICGPDDVRLLRALQIDPRASFASMAAALGVSESALTRRYRRLSAAGVIRVVGVVDPSALGQSRWVVRLRCRPGSAAAIADALAKREDVSWVALVAAGAEVTCAIRSRTAQQRDDLLGRLLPRTASVLDIEAAAILRQFVGGRGHYWAALRGSLTAEEESALGSAGPPFLETGAAGQEPVVLSAEDDLLLSALAEDGRASLVDLAAAARLTPGRVARRLRTLQDRRVVHVDVEVSAAALGFHARAHLWLRVHPASLTDVARTLAGRREVAFVAALTGRDNLHAVVHCHDLDELFALTSDVVGAIPGVQQLEVSPVLRHVKQAGSLLSGDRLVGP